MVEGLFTKHLGCASSRVGKLTWRKGGRQVDAPLTEGMALGNWLGGTLSSVLAS
jgi:hypothetical protein